MKELVFPEYNMNKFIGGQMIYDLGEYYKHNILWGRDLNTWWSMINNNNFWMEAAKDMMEMPMICVMIYIPHVAYKEWKFMWARIDTK